MRAKRLVRWAAILAVLLLALVAAAAIALRSDWAVGRARHELVTRVTDALDAELQIDELTGSLLSDVDIRGLRIVRNGETVISVARAVVRYDAWQLWRSGLTFDRVELYGAEVSLVQEADGWNITKLARPRPAGAPPRDPVDFAIDALSVDASRVTIQPRDGVRRVIDPLNLDGSLAFLDGRLTLDMDGGPVRDFLTGVTLRELEGTMSTGDGRLTFTNLRLVTDASVVTGDVAFRTDDLRATLDADLETAPIAFEDLVPYLPALERLPRSALVTADVQAEAGDISADWTVRSDAGGGTGTWAGRLDGEAIPLVGRAETRALDLSAWLGDPDLASSLDAAVSYDGAIPVDAPEAIDVEFTIAAPRVALLGYRASGVQASGRYARGRLTATGSAAAYGATGSATIGWQRAGRAFTLDGTFSGVDLAQLPDRLDVPPLQSSLAGSASLAGGPDGWHGTATLAPSTLEGASIADGAVASFDTRGETIAYTFDGDLAGLDPSRLGALGEDLFATLEKYPGAITGHVTLDAAGTTMDALAGTIDLDLQSTTLAGIGVEKAAVTASIAAGALDATVSATVRELTDRLVGSSDTVPFRTAGTIAGSVHIDDVREPVTVASIDGDVRIDLGPSTVRSTSLDAVALQARLDGGVATVTRFQATGNGLEAAASGTVALAGERRSDLDVSVTLADLSLLEPYVERDLGGSGSVEGRLTGPPDQPRLVATYGLTDVTSDDASVVSATGTADLLIPDFDPARATGTVTADAELVEAAGLEIRTAQGSVGITPGSFAVDADLTDAARALRVSAVVTPEETRTHVRVSALAVTAGGMTWELAPGTTADIDYRTERVLVSGLSLARDDARIHVDGVFGDPETGTPLVARLERVRLEDFSGLLPEGQTLAGAVEGRVTVTGTRDDPRVSAEFQVGAGTVNGLDFQSFTGTASLDGPRLVTDVVLEAGPLGRFEAAGAVPSPLAEPGARGAYDLVVRSSEISLGFLQPLTTQVTGIAGTGRFDVTVAGPAEEPALDGTVTITGGAFFLEVSGVGYRGVEADLEVRGQQVVVRRFELRDDDDHLASVQGELNLPGIGPPTGFELYVTADELHVLENAYGEVAASASLTVMGDLQTPLISGTITVDRGVIEASDLLDRLSARGYRRAPLVEGDDPEAGPVDRSSLSITLEMPDNVVVRGRDLRSGSGPLGLGDINATIGGALTIAKETAERPIVIGSVRVVRGNYQFQGRRFELQSGSEITFTGSPTNPTLNVDAQREISGVVANVHLGGTLDRPDLVLTSDPPLDQGDVLSLIVFNQAMNALPTEQRVSLAARAGVLAAGAIASPISDSVRRALDLDTFEIRPDETASGASVIVGRQLNERVFIGFRQTFGSSEASQLSFEYRVNELLRIVTSLAQGSEGRSLRSRRTEAAGIDLIFIIR